MSGHSKWSKVKHQKAVTDVVKAKAFTKASRAITVAVKEGGGIADVNGNFKLRLAVELARQVNMPKENIERAIAKASGTEGTAVESLVYEAYGPGGSAFIVECLTENRNRTASAVKNIFDHHEGRLANQGAVLFQFKRVGLVYCVVSASFSADDIFASAVECGADDVIVDDEAIEIITPVSSLEHVRTVLEQKGIVIESSEIMYMPGQYMDVSEDIKMAVEGIIEALEEIDDVQEVYTNVRF
jgi:YebC/PmpR family DNA-binding regulatory protein